MELRLPRHTPRRAEAASGMHLVSNPGFLVFFAANLLHFVHNAEYIAFYPGMPSWLTREKVYLAWIAGVSVGLAGLLLSRTRLKVLGLALIATYGATGIDGLAHYMLALCSEHTPAANLTIWFEVLAGLVLLLVAAVAACRSAVNPRPALR